MKRKTKKAPKKLTYTTFPMASFCCECGPDVLVDEDALCTTCGATCTGSALDTLNVAVRRARAARKGTET